MAVLKNLTGKPGTHLNDRHSKAIMTALKAIVTRANAVMDVDATTGDVTLYLNSAKTTYLTFSTSGGATQLVVLGVDRGSLEAALMGGKDPQESVLDRFDPTAALPVTPSEGDRYLATATANGWTSNRIYTYNSAGAWDEFLPTEGAAMRVEDEDRWYTFDGTNWDYLEKGLVHTILDGLQGGAATEYYHLTQAQHAALIVLSLEGVLDRFDPTGALPAGPADWDAYLATATANGWTDGNCYVWNGSAWVEIVATEGLEVFVADENLRYVFDGAAWGVLQAMDAGAHDHGAATGAGGTHDHGAATGSGGAHSHPITGPSDAGGAHSHPITGPSDAGAAHGHAFTGTVLPTTNAKVDDNAGSVGGTPLFVYCGGVYGMMGTLSANNAVTSTPMDWELEDGSLVMVDHAGAPKGYPVYFDKDLADGERFRCNNTRDGKDIYVPIATGLLVKFVHEGAPSGIAVSFDDGAVADINRLNADFTGAADAGDKTCATDDERVQYGMVAAGTNASESAHTHGLPGTTDAESAHTHGLPSATDAESVHTHGLPGATDAESAHTHSVASEADHTHAITGAVDHAHDVGVA